MCDLIICYLVLSTIMSYSVTSTLKCYFLESLNICCSTGKIFEFVLILNFKRKVSHYSNVFVLSFPYEMYGLSYDRDNPPLSPILFL